MFMNIVLAASDECCFLSSTWLPRADISFAYWDISRPYILQSIFKALLVY